MKQAGAPAVPMGVVGPDGKTAMDDQVIGLGGQVHHHMGEHEEDGSYLELLQSAVGSIHTPGGMPNYRDGIDPARRPNM